MKKRIFAVVLAIVVLIFTGCAKKSSGTASSTVSTKTQMNASTAAAVPPQGTGSAAASYTDGTSSLSKEADTSFSAANNTSDDRKVIYNANVTLIVKDLNAASNSIAGKTDIMGGYIANSNLDQYISQITVKIPASGLNEFLSFLDSVGDKQNSTTSTNDITDQYTDTNSRVRNLEANEEQLLAIMKKANTVEEILKVQSELSKVRGEIETLKGRINMWDKQVEMSTVAIRLNKVQEIGGKDIKPSFISWGEIGKGISNGFIRTLNFVVRFFTGLIIFIISAVPVIPFIALIVWIIYRYRKKIKKNMGK